MKLTIKALDANHRTVSVNKCGLFICRQGSAQILLGTKVFTIKKNYLCVYTPNTLFHIIERSNDLDGLIIDENIDIIFSILSNIDIRKRLYLREYPCVAITDKQFERLNQLTTLIPNEDMTGNDILQSMQRKYLLSALCIEIFKIYDTHQYSPMSVNRENAILNNLIFDIYNKCHTQRTVQYYADKQHLSPYYFSSIIKRLSGKSALQWIEIITLIHAKRYLVHDDLSVKETAIKLNFPDQSTFGRYFKQHEGMSPLKYKKMHKI